MGRRFSHNNDQKKMSFYLHGIRLLRPSIKLKNGLLCTERGLQSIFCSFNSGGRRLVRVDQPDCLQRGVRRRHLDPGQDLRQPSRCQRWRSLPGPVGARGALQHPTMSGYTHSFTFSCWPLSFTTSHSIFFFFTNLCKEL